MTKEQIAELNAWAYEPLTGEGHIHGLVLRLLGEREALLEACRAADDALGNASEGGRFYAAAIARVQAAISKAEGR